jgi:hypothetical protein
LWIPSQLWATSDSNRKRLIDITTHTMKLLIAALLYAISVNFFGFAVAQTSNMDTPDGVMKTVTQQVLDAIKSDKEIEA